MPDSFQLIFIGVLIVLTIGMCFALFQMFRWKVAFDGKEIVAFPSDQLDDLYSALKTLADHVGKSTDATDVATRESTDGHAKVFERVQALLKAVSETRSEYRTLRDELESKSDELERFKEGYDLRLLKKAVQPLLSNHVLVSQELQRDDLSDDHRRFVEQIADNYSDLLDQFEIRIDGPSVGTALRDTKGVRLPPETVPAPSEDQIGTIQAVKTPRYILNYEGNDVIVRDADVVVYAEKSAA